MIVNFMACKISRSAHKLVQTSTLIKKKTNEATKLFNKRGKKDSRLYMASILTKHEKIYSKINKELFIYLKKTTKSCVF
jgi:hypothetical protein